MMVVVLSLLSFSVICYITIDNQNSACQLVHKNKYTCTHTVHTWQHTHIYTKFDESMNKFPKSNLLYKLDLVDSAENNFQIF